MPNQLFCQLRREWVTASPEEQVRQHVIQCMTQEWGYPTANVAIEKSLHQMPHLRLSSTRLPSRRADIVVFAPGIHANYSLYPLLLIECKSIALTDKALRQVVSYNFYLQAQFVAVVNEKEARLGWYHQETKQFRFTEGIPPYQALLTYAAKK